MIARVADRLAPHVDELVVATDRPDLYRDLGVFCVADAVPGYAGPLAGLQAAALHLQGLAKRNVRLVTAPADTPFLPTDFVPRLLDGATPDGLRVASTFGRWHPACAAWPAMAIDHLASLALDAAKAPSLRSVMAAYVVEEIAFPASPRRPAAIRSTTSTHRRISRAPANLPFPGDEAPWPHSDGLPKLTETATSPHREACS